MKLNPIASLNISKSLNNMINKPRVDNKNSGKNKVKSFPTFFASLNKSRRADYLIFITKNAFNLL